MAETDLSTWLTVEQAATAIGVSTRTVERLGKAGKLDQRLRRQEGTPPVAVYYPGDVERERLARRRAPAPFVLAAEQDSPPRNGNGRPSSGSIEALARPTGEDPIHQFFTLLIRAVQSPPSPPVSESVAETHAYVVKADALAIAGISEDELRKAVKAGEVKRRGRRYRRKDLEAL